MRSSVVEMAASTGRPCQLCCCRIDDGKNRRNVGASKSATADLDGLCSEVGQLRTQLVPGPVCRRCFQDLEKLTKAQSTVELLRGQFLCYLRSLKTTLQLPLRDRYRKSLSQNRSHNEKGHGMQLISVRLAPLVHPVDVHLCRNDRW